MSYRMPAEWEPHEGTWVAWPHNRSHWPGKFDPIPGVFAELIKALTDSETVFLLVNDEAMQAHAWTTLAEKGAKLERVEFVRIPTDTSWTRDYGPIFVQERQPPHPLLSASWRMAEGTGGEVSLVITDWIFNSWGGKYAPWDQDDAVPARIAEQFKFPLLTPDIILEGGSIEVNGKGTLITTEQCLLNPNRNRHLNRTQIEEYLKKYLGATHVLWLKEGIVGDDTDGHIDDLAKFVDDHTLVCALESNTNDENYEILKKNYEMLQHMKDQDGNSFHVIPLPMPDLITYEGRRLPASYMNFYIANTVVLVPTFRSEKDAEVLNALSKLFPQRTVVGIDCTDLIWGFGAIHCSTQQQPKE